MALASDLVGIFELAICESAQDSIATVVREFSLAQSRHGLDAAIVALATAYTTAEFRRRYAALKGEISGMESSQP
ncbi:hypothetical protein [Paraburkholderia fungorum]